MMASQQGKRMTHAQYVYGGYYLLLLSTITHLMFIVLEARAYRVTRINGLVPMIIGNVVGLAYFVSILFRQLYVVTPRSAGYLFVAGGLLFTLEVIVGVWGFFCFLKAVQNMASRLQAPQS
jgi:hypothetical protein